jgi:hypothetical protein
VKRVVGALSETRLTEKENHMMSIIEMAVSNICQHVGVGGISPTGLNNRTLIITLIIVVNSRLDGEMEELEEIHHLVETTVVTRVLGIVDNQATRRRELIACFERRTASDYKSGTRQILILIRVVVLYERSHIRGVG